MGQVSENQKSAERSNFKFIRPKMSKEVLAPDGRDDLCEFIFARCKQAIDFVNSKRTRLRVTSAMIIKKPSNLWAACSKLHAACESPRPLKNGLMDPETGREIAQLTVAEYRRHLAFAGLYYASFAAAICAAFYYR